MPGERLARVEPIVPLGMALYTTVLIALNEEATATQWGMVVTLALLGAAGMLGARSSLMVALRGTAVLVAPWFFAWQDSGISHPITIWYAVAIVLYPFVLGDPLGKFYPFIGAAAYLGLAVSPQSNASVAEAGTRTLLLLGAGYLVWLLTTASKRLAGEREKARSEARQAHSRFTMAFANASSGMAVVDRGGKVVEANSALADLVARPLDELEQTAWSEFLHPDDLAIITVRIDEMSPGTRWSFQQTVRCPRPGGDTVWCLLGLSPVPDEVGDPRYMFAQFQDVTELVRTEQQLRLSEEHYRTLFGHTPVAVWELDFTEVGWWLQLLKGEGVADIRNYLLSRPDLVFDGMAMIKVIDVNDAAVGLVESPSKELLLEGIPPAMVTTELQEVLIEQFAAVWEGKDRVEAGAVARTLQGRRIDLVVHWVAPIVSGSLDLSRVVVVFSDVTEYRQTQAALRRIEERLRTVVSAAPIVLFALDRHGTFTLAEGQGLTSLGIQPREAVGRSVFELFHDSPQLMAAVRRAFTGETFTTSIRVKGLDFDTRFTPIWSEGNLEGVVAVGNDITERKRASERLEELVRSKDEFVASVSHELRTPLTAVVGFSQELRQELNQFSREELEMMVTLIADQSMEVADLVEDLLVAARVDVDKVAVTAEPVDIREQVDSVLAAWPAAESSRVGLGGDAAASADPIRVRQIVRNLLTNAQRYGGDRIDVRVGNGGDVVRLMVVDDGPGIPEKDRERIFEPYHRAHRAAGQPGSVGLGLTVSRQLAWLMGGDLTYRREDHESIFELTLPPVEALEAAAS